MTYDRYKLLDGYTKAINSKKILSSYGPRSSYLRRLDRTSLPEPLAVGPLSISAAAMV
jgi:hypothetical protein